MSRSASRNDYYHCPLSESTSEFKIFQGALEFDCSTEEMLSYAFLINRFVCRVPKCPTALNVPQILFFSQSVIMMKEIIINSKINKYFKKIISEKYSESNLEKKCRTFRGTPKVP